MCQFVSSWVKSIRACEVWKNNKKWILQLLEMNILIWLRKCYGSIATNYVHQLALITLTSLLLVGYSVPHKTIEFNKSNNIFGELRSFAGEQTMT